VAPEKASPTLRTLAGPRLFDRARLVGALMRVAFPVSAGMAGPLKRMPLVVEDGKVVLRLPAEWAELNGERLLSRVRGLGRVVGLDGRVEVA
jgi:exopolyphosphatase/guanosine-5'-triphosphate,3'-diphosphate pyrophosphatase